MTRYRIQQGQDPFWTGIDKDGSQVIIGHLYDSIVCVYFTPDGEFKKIERSVVADNESIDAMIGQFKTHEQCTAADIEIQHFLRPDLGIGILELPGEYESYLLGLDQYDEDDRSSYDEAIQEWRNDGSFVFLWGSEYWMSAEGEIVS